MYLPRVLLGQALLGLAWHNVALYVAWRGVAWCGVAWGGSVAEVRRYILTVALQRVQAWLEASG